MPTRRRFLPKLLLVLSGFLFGILVAEVALRIAGYSFPEFYQADPTRGFALRPNVAGWYTKEGEAYVLINSAGLRDGEHHRLKALGERLGIAHIILAPDLQRYADQNRAFLHGSQHNLGNGHWNSTGHRVAGEFLAAKFCGGLFREIAQPGQSD